MAGQKQSVELVLARGKKHLTKKEIEERRAQEIKAPADRVEPPKYLLKKQAKKFEKIAGELVALGIMTNLDCDALARYIQSEDRYQEYDGLVKKAMAEAKNLEKAIGIVGALEKFEGLRDKALKQCRAAAADLGLTISSRCKLVAPKAEKPHDPLADMFGDRSDTG